MQKFRKFSIVLVICIIAGFALIKPSFADSEPILKDVSVELNNESNERFTVSFVAPKTGSYVQFEGYWSEKEIDESGSETGTNYFRLISHQLTSELLEKSGVQDNWIDEYDYLEENVENNNPTHAWWLSADNSCGLQGIKINEKDAIWTATYEIDKETPEGEYYIGFRAFNAMIYDDEDIATNIDYERDSYIISKITVTDKKTNIADIEDDENPEITTSYTPNTGDKIVLYTCIFVVAAIAFMILTHKYKYIAVIIICIFFINNFGTITTVDKKSIKQEIKFATSEIAYSEENIDDVKYEDISYILEKYTAHISDLNEENKAWGITYTGMDKYIEKLGLSNDLPEIRVAVLDTGVNINHEIFTDNELADRIDMTYSYDYVNNDNDPEDDNGHGTRVAGAIAESTLSNVKIVPVKVMDGSGDGGLNNIFKAISDLSDKVDIINLSLGSDISGISDADMETIEEMLESIVSNTDVIIVCAAGNSRGEVEYPASSRYTLAASAIDKENNLASFSCYGEEIDFVLPGVSVILPYYAENNAYTESSGTSISCAFLSSAIALIKSENPNYNSNQVLDILKTNAKDLGATGKDNYFGYGSVDFNVDMFAYKAVKGDINFNEIVDENDIIEFKNLMKESGRIDNLTELEENVFDVDENGIINGNDVAALKNLQII